MITKSVMTQSNYAVLITNQTYHITYIKTSILVTGRQPGTFSENSYEKSYKQIGS